MKLIVLAVGRVRVQAIKSLCEDYLSRLQRYGATELREVKAAGSASGGAAIESAVAQESARLQDEILPGDAIHILDERGAQISSLELSTLFKTHELSATRRLVFILGGAFGLSADLKKRGRLIALSRLTFPHELCRAIVLEQLYRARTIQRGEPYHHF